MGPQDLLPLRALKVCTDYPKGLVVIKARVKLQGRIGNREAGLFKRFLETAQTLRHAVNKGALNIENITRKHIDPAGGGSTTADNTREVELAVNADVPSVEVIMLPEQDNHINPAGVNGIGELGNVGTNAAVCNAIFHATGQRLRKLPVRLGQLDI
jgi:hypothetical protein